MIRSGTISVIYFTVPILVVGLLLLGLGVIAYRWFGTTDPGTTVAVSVPELSTLATQGEKSFDENCGSCHGTNAGGTDKGPPLVHKIYNPGHHGDAAFYRAARSGAPQHHWPFGDMPAQPKVSDDELAAIIRYVRELQAANGIVSEQHTM